MKETTGKIFKLNQFYHFKTNNKTVKMIHKLPVWAKIMIRVILLPIAFILHLIPHIIGLVVNLKNWVVYGGEFISYTKDDKASMAKIFNELKKQNS